MVLTAILVTVLKVGGVAFVGHGLWRLVGDRVLDRLDLPL